MFKSNTRKVMGNNLALYDVFADTKLFGDDFFSEFDRLFGNAFADSHYPPTNTRKTQEGYIIEMALAGYKKEDIAVTQQDNILTISAKKQDEASKDDYIHKGISYRSFNRSFTLGKTSEVKEVSLTNGLLTVTITQAKPENKLITFDIK